jgi:hypothetical protein
VLFRDLRGYQELVFGAYVRNAMFFATLPYYLAQKMRRDRFGSHASDVSEPRSPLSSDTALGRKRNSEVARVTSNPARLDYLPRRVTTSVYQPDQR